MARERELASPPSSPRWGQARDLLHRLFQIVREHQRDVAHLLHHRFGARDHGGRRGGGHARRARGRQGAAQIALCGRRGAETTYHHARAAFTLAAQLEAHFAIVAARAEVMPQGKALAIGQQLLERRGQQARAGEVEAIDQGRVAITDEPVFGDQERALGQVRQGHAGRARGRRAALIGGGRDVDAAHAGQHFADDVGQRQVAGAALARDAIDGHAGRQAVFEDVRFVAEQDDAGRGVVTTQQRHQSVARGPAQLRCDDGDVGRLLGQRFGEGHRIIGDAQGSIRKRPPEQQFRKLGVAHAAVSDEDSGCA